MHWQTFFKLFQFLSVKMSLTLKYTEGRCVFRVLILVCQSRKLHVIFPGRWEDELRLNAEEETLHIVYLVLFVHAQADIFAKT